MSSFHRESSVNDLPHPASFSASLSALPNSSSIPMTMSPRLQSMGYAVTPLHGVRKSTNTSITMLDDFRLNEDGENFSHLTLDQYVKHMGGTRAISRVLIANNGIAAVKAIRSIKNWAYNTFGNDKVIQFVVMATPEDLRANAEYIHLADEFVKVPGGSNNHNYANIDLITDIAESTKCHAVWAGWGHASENPKLPDKLNATKSKIVWIGPPSHAMRALGDKIGSTLIAQSAGVPCMPWSGDGLEVDYRTQGIPDDLYSKSCVATPEQAITESERIGFPVMIKASEGGGGKGIRRIETSEEVEFAFRQVQGEVPGSPVFIMKLAGSCRHLEVQLLCDSLNNAVAVFGRDCSIQRRHQKIIEEGPVVAAPPHVWEEMEKSAVRLAQEVGYVGAGTVEYLYMEDGTYSFLELNPRLQVEHPVTELISGVNLPAAQLQIAMGIPLHRMPGIRRMYGESPVTEGEIDFNSRRATTLGQHVIACRITAENPDDKFQPTSGMIQELHFRSTPDVWGYFSVGPNGQVHEFADSQFGHIFAVGPTRDIARKNMVQALRELEIRGEIRTTIEYLRVILEADDFRNNNISTTWLEKVQSEHALTTQKPSQYLALACGALFRAHVYAEGQEVEYNECLQRGHLPSDKLYGQLVRSQQELIYEGTKFAFDVSKSGPNSYDLTLVTPPGVRNVKSDASIDCAIDCAIDKTLPHSPRVNSEVSSSSSASDAFLPPIRELVASCDVHNLSDGGYLVLLNGKKHVMYGKEFPSGLRLTVDAMTCLFQQEYDPTVLRSDTQGKLVQWLKQSGSHVKKGDAVAELEVMKMYVTIRAPEAGVITTLKPAGSVIEAGDLIARFALDHPEMVQKAEVFSGVFTEADTVTPDEQKINVQLKDAENKLQMLISGYELAPGVLDCTVKSLIKCLLNPTLPSFQFREVVSNIASRIPSDLYDSLMQIVDTYDADLSRDTRRDSISLSNCHFKDFPAQQIINTIDAFLAHAPCNVNVSTVTTNLQDSGLNKLLQDYTRGNQTQALGVLLNLMNSYLVVEEAFANVPPVANNAVTTFEDAIHALRSQHKDDVTKVSTMARAHVQRGPRAALISVLFDTIEDRQLVSKSDRAEWVSYLQRLAALKERYSASLALKARQALVSLRLPSQRTRLVATLRILKSVLNKRKGESASDSGVDSSVDDLIDQTQPIEDVILRFLSHADPDIRALAAEAYVRRAFKFFKLSSFQFFHHPSVQDVAPNSTATSSVSPTLISRWCFYKHIEDETVTGIAGPAALALENHVSSCGSIDLVDSNSISQSNSGAEISGISQSATSKRMLRVDSLAALNTLSRTPSSLDHEVRSPTILEENDDEPVQDSHLPAGVLQRMGVMASFDTMEDAKAGFLTALHAFSAAPKNKHVSAEKPIHVLYINVTSLRADTTEVAEALFNAELQPIINAHADTLKHYQVRRITFMAGINATPAGPIQQFAPTPAHLELCSPSEESFLSAAVGTPAYITFKVSSTTNKFEEDKTLRNIEPNNAIHLELDRLSHFDYQLVQTTNRMVHLFAAVPKNRSVKSGGRPMYDGRRFFTRVLVRRLDSVQRSRILKNGKHVIESDNSQINANVPGTADAHPETEVAFVEALNSLEIAMGMKDPDPHSLLNAPGGNGKWMFNHIFVNVLVDVSVESNASSLDDADVSSAALVNVDYVDSIIRSLTRRYSEKIRRLNVTHVEFALTIRFNTSTGITSMPVRFVCSNPTGFVLHVDVFFEKMDRKSGKVLLVPFKVRSGPQLDFTNLHPYCFSSSPTLSPDTYSFGSGVSPVTSPVAIPAVCKLPFMDADSPYPTTYPFQKQRLSAAAFDTVWCYDFLEIIEKTVRRSWRGHLLALLEQGFQMAMNEVKEHGESHLMVLLQILMKFLFSNEWSTDNIKANITRLRQAPLSIFKTAAIAIIGAANADSIDPSLPNADLMKTLSKYISNISPEAQLMVSEFAQVGVRIPKVFIQATELVLTPNPQYSAYSDINSVPAGQHQSPDDIVNNGFAGYSSKYVLEPVDREYGLNNIAMVAWDLTLFTPETLTFSLDLKPQPENNLGRKIVLIANDITTQAGSFGTEEDILFDLASKRARELEIPRIYLTANSGARIGLADELKGRYKIAFVGSGDDNKGFEYLYLDPATYEELKTSVICTPIEVDGEERYVITDIIGKQNNLGVENLQGSGTIAGETSRAYNDVFTLTYVTCRTVGIGAYLSRLGHRVIQKADPSMPLLLTGYQALNKLLGRPVYTSNVQLGGPSVMYQNGISHQVVGSDIEGVVNILRWLSYVPVKRRQQPPMLLQTLDRINRPVTFAPSGKTALYDPRALLQGLSPVSLSQEAADAEASPGVPLTGIFDHGSFMEVLGGWAKGIVTGRARLGGLPVGVIAVDPRTTDFTIAADPAGADTKETTVTRPGLVWYPESAFKTAQAIFDLVAEDLPLVFMANFRGFAGDEKSMRDEVLKFGSYIVDALIRVQRPIIVYLPPHATLRGGAYVVVSETINEDYMQIFADPSARANVLEPEGIIELKYRREAILAEMYRLDDKLCQMKESLKTIEDPILLRSVKNDMKTREKTLYPVYVQIATHFADLMDTPRRMTSKGSLRAVVDWTSSRERFYWNLRARLIEQQIVESIIAAAQNKHNLIEFSRSAGLSINTDSLPLTTTTTVASDIKIARGLLQLWLNELSAKCPAKITQPLLTADCSNSVQSDTFFVKSLSCPHVKRLIDQKIVELKKDASMKTVLANLQGMDSSDIAELVAKLQKMIV